MQSHHESNWHETYKEVALFGRYITLHHISSLLQKQPIKFNLKEIGTYVLNRPIHSLTIGNGEKKILI